MFPQKNIVRDHWGVLLLCLSAFIAASYGDCGAPLRLDFAIVGDQFIGQNTFSVGANVTYTCIAGYIRIPGSKNVSYCLSNSTWSTPETFCQRRNCGPPGDPVNGDVHIEDTLFGFIVNYTCHTGYKMISKKNYRECLADGTWSNEVPVCQVQICAPPNAITNGSYSPEHDEYQYQDVVIYQCNGGKKIALIGEASIVCTSYGNWSSDAPKCVDVECSSPNVANANKLSGFAGPYYYTFAVTFECIKGFLMKGANLVKCNASSQWDPPLPTCYASCAPPNAITDGSFSPVKGEYAYEDVVKYQCNGEKFSLQGQPSIACTSYGNWSSNAPKCVAVPSCAPPNAITDGSFSPVKGQYAYEDVVKYQCNEKTFLLLGQPSIACTSYGNWSSNAPQCVAIPSCAPPNAITDGSFSPVKGQYAYKDVVKYQCNGEKFSLQGQPSIACTSYGNWSSNAPKCVENNVAEFVGNSIVLLTMILMGYVISHHF